MTLKEFFQSKTFSLLLYSIGVILLVLVIFVAGMLMGYHQASVSYRWGENYYRNFVGGPHGGDFRGLGRDEFINGHGLFGSILSITSINNSNINGLSSGEVLVVKDKDNTEKIVLVAPNTTVRRDREAISMKDLQVNMLIIALGTPNNEGQIEAKLIRILPPTFTPPPFSSSIPFTPSTPPNLPTH